MGIGACQPFRTGCGRFGNRSRISHSLIVSSAGIGAGKTAAQDAAAAAISSPLLDSTIDNAKGVVFNISGGPNLSLNEVNQAAKYVACVCSLST